MQAVHPHFLNKAVHPHFLNKLGNAWVDTANTKQASGSLIARWQDQPALTTAGDTGRHTPVQYVAEACLQNTGDQCLRFDEL